MDKEKGKRKQENETARTPTPVVPVIELKVSEQEEHQIDEDNADNVTVGADNKFDNGTVDRQDMVYLVPPRIFIKRYEARIKLDESEDPAAEARAKLRAFYKTLHNSDKTMVIYPWKDEFNKGSPLRCAHKTLQNPNDIPKNPSSWKIHFERANPLAKGGWTYPSLYLGHSKSFEVIMEDIKWWLSAGKHGWYQRQLQCDTTCILGWGLYSLQSMNADIFREAISMMSGVDIGVRWRTIPLPKAGSAPKDKLAKAFHFECNVEKRVQATKALRKCKTSFGSSDQFNYEFTYSTKS